MNDKINDKYEVYGGKEKYLKYTKDAWSRASSFPVLKENVYPEHKIVQEFDSIKDSLILDYGCLPKNTMISTINGLIPIQNINSGQKIYNTKIDENYSLIPHTDVVEKVIDQGIKSTYTINTYSNTIRATEEHKFLVIKRIPSIDEVKNTGRRKVRKVNFYPVWVETKDLQKNDILVRQKSVNDDNILTSFVFPKTNFNKTNKQKLKLEKTSSLFMKLVGFFLGDGNIHYDSRDGNPYCIELSEPINGKYRDKYVNLLNVLFENSDIKITNDDRKIYIHSVELGRLFIYLQLNNNVYNKRIPSWCFSLPYEERLALLEGIIDSDGYRLPNKIGNVRSQDSTGNVALQLANKELILDVKNLCLSLNIYCSRNINYRKQKNPLKKLSHHKDEVESYTLHIGLIEKEKRTFPGTYKQHVGKYLLNKNFTFDIIKDVSYFGKEHTYDLKINKEHNFIADGFVVHNCGGGPDAISYLKRGNYVILCDITPTNIETAKKNVGPLSEKADFCLLEESHVLPFPDNEFDIINSHGVIMHIIEPEPVLRELVRVLAPTGTMYVMLYTEFLYEKGREIITELMKQGLSEGQAFCQFTDGPDAPYARYYTEEQGRQLFLDCGLKTLSCSVYNNCDFRTFKLKKL